MEEPPSLIVEEREIRRFMIDSLIKFGLSQEHANALADNLVSADQRGHYSHGLNRIDYYTLEIGGGVIATTGSPRILADKPSTAWVDGGNLIGPIVGNYCMDLAIAKAKVTGIGWVTAHNSNHFGIAGHYALRASEQGLIGMAFTNTSPVVVPTRAAKPTLGTNPLSIAAPGQSDSVVLDMATSSVAFGKVELAARKGLDIPSGWALDASGRVTTDPGRVMGLCPLGGMEITSGYKGYGLSLAVDILTGVLSGGAWGPHVRKWLATNKVADLGQTYVALDPCGFAPGFGERLQGFIQELRNLDPVEPDKPVLVPGDPEKDHIELCRKLGGIPYHPNQIQHVQKLAKEWGVQPPKVKGSG